jgi:threonine dehydratase
MLLPISFADVLHARDVLRNHLLPTPLRHYRLLDDALGNGARVLVKHENHQPTCSFKVRNGIAAVAALTPEQRARGIVAATRGNHGQGLAGGGQLLGAHVTVCVPHGNSSEKNAAMRAMGATLMEVGRDYDDAVGHASLLVQQHGLTLVHSSNNPDVLAGAATLTLEIVEQTARLDALVVALGGGSQAVGAITVLRQLAPHVEIYAVQAANASAQHDGLRAGHMVEKAVLPTLADGLATRTSYDLTFEAMFHGLTACITVTEAEIAEAMRVTMRTTHNLLEGAAGAAFAGLWKLKSELADKTVAVVLSGSNIDQDVLRRVLNGEV